MFLMKSRCPGASITLRVVYESLTSDHGEKKSYRDHVFWGLELPKGNINGDTTLTLSLELIQDPG